MLKLRLLEHRGGGITFATFLSQEDLNLHFLLVWTDTGSEPFLLDELLLAMTFFDIHVHSCQSLFRIFYALYFSPVFVLLQLFSMLLRAAVSRIVHNHRIFPRKQHLSVVFFGCGRGRVHHHGAASRLEGFEHGSSDEHFIVARTHMLDFIHPAEGAAMHDLPSSVFHRIRWYRLQGGQWRWRLLQLLHNRVQSIHVEHGMAQGPTGDQWAPWAHSLRLVHGSNLLLA